MMGITGINTRESPYRVIIETLKGLPRTQLDAVVGISSLVLLTVIRNVCAKLEVRQPARKRFWAMVSSLRLTFAMLLYTLIAWLVHRTLPKDVRKFRLVGHIESGEFPHIVAVPWD
jgi:sodium-independent sulfate anion transporter 11